MYVSEFLSRQSGGLCIKIPLGPQPSASSGRAALEKGEDSGSPLF